MQRYLDLDRDSGINGYENGPDFIRVRFSKGPQYIWHSARIGVDNLRRMQTLAVAGDGLNEFINRYVKKSFTRREL